MSQLRHWHLYHWRMFRKFCHESCGRTSPKQLLNPIVVVEGSKHRMYLDHLSWISISLLYVLVITPECPALDFFRTSIVWIKIEREKSMFQFTYGLRERECLKYRISLVVSIQLEGPWNMYVHVPGTNHLIDNLLATSIWIYSFHSRL